MKLEIIFRGQGLRVSDDERAYYESLPNVNVRWQKKAWADEGYMVDYLVAFREATLDRGEVLLGMDRHGSQKTPAIRTFYDLTGIVPAFTPANCTDCTSPVDKHVGQTLKVKIGRKYHEWLETDINNFDKAPSKNLMRRLIAGWASEAWADLCANHQDLIRSAFVKTGFLVAKDGSENHMIELWGSNGRYTNTAPDGIPYTF